MVVVQSLPLPLLLPPDKYTRVRSATGSGSTNDSLVCHLDERCCGARLDATGNVLLTTTTEERREKGILLGAADRRSMHAGLRFSRRN